MTSSARRVGLSGDVDLLNVAGEDGFLFETGDHGIAGRGEALRLEVDYQPGGLAHGLTAVSKALSNVANAGSPPVAFVSVPFINSRPILAVVPEVTVHRNLEGRSYATTFGDSEIPATFGPPTSMDTPRSFSIRPSRSPKEWCDAVDEAIARIRTTDLDKVVLARELVLEADNPLSQVSILRQLRRNYPSSYRFALDGFIGASPELLIERDGLEIHAQPMAGTVARSNDPDADARLGRQLRQSGKNRSEHRSLVDMVRETLEPYCDRLHTPSDPDVVSLANVHHLATSVSGVLHENTNVLELVAALQPTPAVGGRPTKMAIDVIAELEELDRGRYAGAVGWVDAEGNGCFAVAIRCAQLHGSVAKLYAGCGIVAASEADQELEESNAKFQPMISAIIRP